MTQKSFTLDKEIKKRVKLNYLLHLPEGYGKDSNKKWPIILFLHGAGERGEDIERVKVHGIPMIAEEGRDLPFIAASPQCPENSFWSMENEALIALLDEIIATYAVDTERVYLTGLSMGGYGTWSLAVQHPERFAAIAPICGGGNPALVKSIKDVPVWTFHGKKDSVVPIEETEAMVKALEEAGGNVKFTIYQEADHNSWTETYNNPELYQWFLSHKLGK